MSQKKSELPQLPSLGELEARAEAELGKDPEGPEVEVHRRTINEIICPILERYMIEQGIKGTAKVHILPGNVVVCEKFMKNHEVFDGTRHSGCQLRHRYEGRSTGVDKLVYDDCPYKTLHC
ncbi:MAG TPA: hypothetical protein VJH37_01970 [Candidatus Nanoarchaeia archaeon]|nr:hypothetical protein [Candidatus Nanoarchaeia archaeon]